MVGERQGILNTGSNWFNYGLIGNWEFYIRFEIEIEFVFGYFDSNYELILSVSIFKYLFLFFWLFSRLEWLI